RDSRFALKPIDQFVKTREQLTRGEIDGFKGVRQVSQIANLRGEQLLNVVQLGDDMVGITGTEAERVDLHLQADQGLDDAIVEFACEAGALQRADAASHAPKQIDAVHRRRDLVRE